MEAGVDEDMAVDAAIGAAVDMAVDVAEVEPPKRDTYVYPCNN